MRTAPCGGSMPTAPWSHCSRPRRSSGGGYVVVWVADDPGETDNDPSADGNGLVLVHAEGFGERGSNRSVEASAVRAASTSVETGYVAQRGQDEQNRRARKGAVQTPGAGLTEMLMSLSTGGIS